MHQHNVAVTDCNRDLLVVFQLILLYCTVGINSLCVIVIIAVCSCWV